jgi:hypothetical protein
VDAASLAAERRPADVATVVNTRLAAVSADVRERLTGTIRELRGDEQVAGLLTASVDSNVTTLLHILGHDIVPEEHEAPAAALEYARRPGRSRTW